MPKYKNTGQDANIVVDGRARHICANEEFETKEPVNNPQFTPVSNFEPENKMAKPPIKKECKTCRK